MRLVSILPLAVGVALCGSVVLIFANRRHDHAVSTSTSIALIGIQSTSLPRPERVQRLRVKAPVLSTPSPAVSRRRMEDAFQWLARKHNKQCALIIEILNGRADRAPVYLDVGTNVGVFPVKVGNACPTCIIHGLSPLRRTLILPV